MRQRAFLTLNGHPIYSFSNMAREFNRELSSAFENDYYSESFYPQFIETDDAFLATLDVPGVNFSDVNIEIEDNKLFVNAERKNPFDKNGESIKKYSHVYALPKDIEEDKINAHYENGVLSLTIPKVENHKLKKKIQISTGQKPKSWSNFLNFKKNENELQAN